jgi:hypothetical protein
MGKWTIDRTPYHITHPSSLDNGRFTNSFSRNRHTFNIAKYYKEQFHLIPRLAQYDIIIWLDGTRAPASSSFTEHCLKMMRSSRIPIITLDHVVRKGILRNEVKASHFNRYTSTFWNNQQQPYQDVDAQYRHYREQGFIEQWLANITVPYRTKPTTLGVWITAIVAFNMTDPVIRPFLNEWFAHNLNFTTQDQVSFPYVCWKFNIVPCTLPDNEVPVSKLLRCWGHSQ